MPPSRAPRGCSPIAPGRASVSCRRRAAPPGSSASTLWSRERGELLRRYRDGDAGIPGYAEDYAFLVFGLLELFQADGDAAWLEWALELQRAQDERFWDEEDGGWFSTTGADPTVLLRLKEDYDGAEPSASAVSVLEPADADAPAAVGPVAPANRADAGPPRPSRRRRGARRSDDAVRPVGLACRSVTGRRDRRPWCGRHQGARTRAGLPLSAVRDSRAGRAGDAGGRRVPAGVRARR